MTPKPECDSAPPTSTFSVTGFLTFSVVAATSLANIIANINNNNNNNNDNNNNENQNDNNQISNNAMGGGRRKRSVAREFDKFDFCNRIPSNEPHGAPNGFLYTSIQYASKLLNSCPEQYICNAIAESNQQSDNTSQKLGLFVITIASFILTDFYSNLTYEKSLKIIRNASTDNKYCHYIKC